MLHATHHTPFHTIHFLVHPLFHTQRDRRVGVVKGEEKGRVVVVWCGQSDRISKPCKTQPTHNTTHKPHMPPTPSITHPQHQQVHPHSPFLLCVQWWAEKREGVVVGGGQKHKERGDGGWKGWMVSPINTPINNAVCGVLSHNVVHPSVHSHNTHHTQGMDGMVVLLMRG